MENKTMTRIAFALTLRRSLATAGFLLMLALGIASPAYATKVSTHLSINARTDLQIQNCEDLGGTATSNTVKGSVTNGHQPIKSTTTCTGGGLDGVTCTNVKGSTSCIGRTAPNGQPVVVNIAANGSVSLVEQSAPTATPAPKTGTTVGSQVIKQAPVQQSAP
jgi:hypothetical protein